jgi:hypothetical protein
MARDQVLYKEPAEGALQYASGSPMGRWPLALVPVLVQVVEVVEVVVGR